MTSNLSQDSLVEGTGHVIQSELGGERQSGELGVLRVLETERLDADEIFVAVRANAGVWGELDRRGSGNVHRVDDELQRGLLLSISNVDGDLCIAEVLEGGCLTVILPRDRGSLSTVEGTRSGRAGKVDGSEGGGSSEGKNSEGLEEHLDC